jgi:hypothetical protein
VSSSEGLVDADRDIPSRGEKAGGPGEEPAGPVDSDDGSGQASERASGESVAAEEAGRFPDADPDVREVRDAAVTPLERDPVSRATENAEAEGRDRAAGDDADPRESLVEPVTAVPEDVGAETPAARDVRKGE